MPYRALPRRDRCRYCKRETALACMACAHYVCEACQATHDEQYDHRTYSG